MVPNPLLPGDCHEQTFQVLSLDPPPTRESRGPDLNPPTELDQQLNALTEDQKRYLYISSIGNIEQASVASGYFPITSLY